MFISFHADLPIFLSWCSSHLFADDLAATAAGQIGVKYSVQCLDIERRLKQLLVQLEAYSILCAQPINIKKTEAMWSARAIGSPSFDLEIAGEKLTWIKEYKYLGYWLCSNLAWGKMIRRSSIMIRQRIASICALRVDGESSSALRRALLSSFVYPLFPWMFPIFPLFSAIQQNELGTFITRVLNGCCDVPNGTITSSRLLMMKILLRTDVSGIGIATSYNWRTRLTVTFSSRRPCTTLQDKHGLGTNSLLRD